MRFNEQSRLLTRLVNGQANIESWLRLQQVSARSLQLPIAEGRASTCLCSQSSIMSIKASSPFSYGSTCISHCECSCHITWDYQSPTILHRAFGTLFAGYSGYPTQIFRKCSCEYRLGPHAYFYYLFPSWFLTNAITFTFTRVSLVKVHTALAVRRIVPVGADVFRLANLNDVDGMKELLRTGLASPDDSDIAGNTVSIVSKRSLIFVS